MTMLKLRSIACAALITAFGGLAGLVSTEAQADEGLDDIEEIPLPPERHDLQDNNLTTRLGQSLIEEVVEYSETNPETSWYQIQGNVLKFFYEDGQCHATRFEEFSQGSVLTEVIDYDCDGMVDEAKQKEFDSQGKSLKSIQDWPTDESKPKRTIVPKYDSEGNFSQIIFYEDDIPDIFVTFEYCSGVIDMDFSDEENGERLFLQRVNYIRHASNDTLNSLKYKLSGSSYYIPNIPGNSYLSGPYSGREKDSSWYDFNKDGEIDLTITISYNEKDNIDGSYVLHHRVDSFDLDQDTKPDVVISYETFFQERIQTEEATKEIHLSETKTVLSDYDFEFSSFGFIEHIETEDGKQTVIHL